MNISYNYNIKGELVNEGLFIQKDELAQLIIKIELLKMRKLKMPDQLLENLNSQYLKLEKVERKIFPKKIIGI